MGDGTSNGGPEGPDVLADFLGGSEASIATGNATALPAAQLVEECLVTQDQRRERISDRLANPNDVAVTRGATDLSTALRGLQPDDQGYLDFQAIPPQLNLSTGRLNLRDCMLDDKSPQAIQGVRVLGMVTSSLDNAENSIFSPVAQGTATPAEGQRRLDGEDTYVTAIAASLSLLPEVLDQDPQFFSQSFPPGNLRIEQIPPAFTATIEEKLAAMPAESTSDLETRAVIADQILRRSESGRLHEWAVQAKADHDGRMKTLQAEQLAAEQQQRHEQDYAMRFNMAAEAGYYMAADRLRVGLESDSSSVGAMMPRNLLQLLVDQGIDMSHYGVGIEAVLDGLEDISHHLPEIIDRLKTGGPVGQADFRYQLDATNRTFTELSEGERVAFLTSTIQREVTGVTAGIMRGVVLEGFGRGNASLDRRLPVWGERIMRLMGRGNASNVIDKAGVGETDQQQFRTSVIELLTGVGDLPLDLQQGAKDRLAVVLQSRYSADRPPLAKVA